VLQVNKSTALEAERLAILETERCDVELSRAAARLRDVKGLFPRSRHDLETRLSKKNLAVSRRRLGPERKRRMQIWK
jgi:hypothetical protein